jgi:hypothetical protein
VGIEGPDRATVADNFESIVVNVPGMPPLSAPLVDLGGVSPYYFVDISALLRGAGATPSDNPLGRGAVLVVRKRTGREQFTGQLMVRIEGSWLRSPSTASRTDQHVVRLSFTVDIPAGRDVVVAQLQPTISNEDLINHLDDNALHYSQAIWRNLDGATLGHLLDHYTISVRGSETSLARLLDPTPVSVVGNYLIFRMPFRSPGRRELACIPKG